MTHRQTNIKTLVHTKNKTHPTTRVNKETKTYFKNRRSNADNIPSTLNKQSLPRNHRTLKNPRTHKKQGTPNNLSKQRNQDLLQKQKKQCR